MVKCIGNKINSEAYNSSLSDKIDEKNQLKVNEYFQVEGLDDVFAIGDCCDSKEIKEAYVAGAHAGNLDALNPIALYRSNRARRRPETIYRYFRIS